MSLQAAVGNGNGGVGDDDDDDDEDDDDEDDEEEEDEAPDVGDLAFMDALTECLRDLREQSVSQPSGAGDASDVMPLLPGMMVCGRHVSLPMEDETAAWVAAHARQVTRHAPVVQEPARVWLVAGMCCTAHMAPTPCAVRRRPPTVKG